MVCCHGLPEQGKENGTDYSGEPENQITYYVLVKSSYHNAYETYAFGTSIQKFAFSPTVPHTHGDIELRCKYT